MTDQAVVIAQLRSEVAHLRRELQEFKGAKTAASRRRWTRTARRRLSPTFARCPPDADRSLPGIHDGLPVLA
jgi:hypothetical protein